VTSEPGKKLPARKNISIFTRGITIFFIANYPKNSKTFGSITESTQYDPDILALLSAFNKIFKYKFIETLEQDLRGKEPRQPIKGPLFTGISGPRGGSRYKHRFTPRRPNPLRQTRKLRKSNK
jgi:hypothetical protein